MIGKKNSQRLKIPMKALSCSSSGTDVWIGSSSEVRKLHQDGVFGEATMCAHRLAGVGASRAGVAVPDVCSAPEPPLA